MESGEEIDFNLSAAPIPDSQKIVCSNSSQSAPWFQLDLATIPFNNETFFGDTSEINKDLDQLVEDLAAMIALDGKQDSFLNLIKLTCVGRDG